MFNWIKDLFKRKPRVSQYERLEHDIDKMLAEVRQKPKRLRLYKQATVVTTGELPKEKEMAAKPGLYANIHKKQERIEKQKASGAKKVETMRKPGTKGAPIAEAFKQSAKTAKAKK
jgi:hypothetical protein